MLRPLSAGQFFSLHLSQEDKAIIHFIRKKRLYLLETFLFYYIKQPTNKKIKEI